MLQILLFSIISALPLNDGRDRYSLVAPTSCPPIGFSSSHDVNLTIYISQRWYIQAQQSVSYLPESSNYCVTAKYTLGEQESQERIKKVLGPILKPFNYDANELDLYVYNYANQDSVNGKPMIGNLHAVALNPKTAPGELLVGPHFVPRVLWGPYTIVSVGANYEWALVSGGPPTIPGVGGYCKNGDGINNSGLWILTKAKKPSPILVDTVYAVAKSLGFDTTVLKRVVQTGCNYENLQNV